MTIESIGYEPWWPQKYAPMNWFMLVSWLFVIASLACVAVRFGGSWPAVALLVVSLMAFALSVLWPLAEANNQ